MKKLLPLLFLLLWFPNVSHAALTTNIVSYYTFDQTLNDVTGNGYNGTGTSITYTAGGKINYSALFDGTSSHVDVSGLTTTISGNYSINEWVYIPNNTSGSNSAIYSTRSPSEYGTDLSVNYPTFGLHGDIGNGTAWLTTAADISYTFSNSVWYMITAVYTTTGWTYYVNGSSVGSGTYSGTPVFTDTNHYPVIGAYRSTGGVYYQFFYSSIDEVGIWSRALTSTEVTQLYNSGAGLQYPFGITTVSAFTHWIMHLF